MPKERLSVPSAPGTMGVAGEAASGVPSSPTTAKPAFTRAPPPFFAPKISNRPCSRPDGAKTRRAIGWGFPAARRRSLSTGVEMRRPAAGGTSKSWSREPTRPLLESRTTTRAW